MQKYESPVRKSETTNSGDLRTGSRRVFDSLFARFLRLGSVSLGIYAVVGILFGILMIFVPISANDVDEDEFRSRRQQLGLATFALIGSGLAAGYGSYRMWNTASNVRRSNRRRAKGLTEDWSIDLQTR